MQRAGGVEGLWNECDDGNIAGLSRNRQFHTVEKEFHGGWIDGTGAIDQFDNHRGVRPDAMAPGKGATFRA